MKKIIAVLLILACFGTAVFANPIASEKVTDLVLSGYEGNALASNRFNQEASPQLKQNALSVDKTGILGTITEETDDLFAAVQAPQLTDTEAVQVEGDGFFGFVVGGLLGGIGGIFYHGSTSNYAWNTGAVIGMILGSFLPF